MTLLTVDFLVIIRGTIRSKAGNWKTFRGLRFGIWIAFFSLLGGVRLPNSPPPRLFKSPR